MLTRKHYLSSLVILTTVLFGVWFFANRKWEELTIPHSRCASYIADSSGLIEAIEDFNRRNGRFPESLEELEKGDIPGTLKDLVRYQLLTVGGYQIEIETIKGLTDSYDAIFYRPGKSYPNQWKAKLKTHRIGDWIYVIGAQKRSRES